MLVKDLEEAVVFGCLPEFLHDWVAEKQGGAAEVTVLQGQTSADRAGVRTGASPSPSLLLAPSGLRAARPHKCVVSVVTSRGASE